MTDFERRIADLEAQLAELKAAVATPSSKTRKGSSEAVEEVNRRALLRRGGVVIAGAAAGGAVLIANANPVAAANGDAITVGGDNVGTLTTTIRTTSTNQTLFVQGRSGLSAATTGPAPLRIVQQLQPDSMPTKADGWGDTGSLASIVRGDSGADLWYAHAGEDKTAANQNVWGRVQTSQNSNYVQFLSTPSRVLDTRSSGGPVASNSTNVYTLSAAPADAVGVMGTITLVDAQAPGAYLSLYAGNIATIASPSFSNVNAGPGVNAATSFIVSLPTTKQIKVFASTACQILIDVAAWVVTGPRP